MAKTLIKVIEKLLILRDSIPDYESTFTSQLPKDQ